MKHILCVLGYILSALVTTEAATVGVFKHQSNIGEPIHSGSARYDEVSQYYTLKGAGYNI